MSTIRRSLAFSFAEKYGSYALSLVGTVIVSRLLTPKDFGLFAVGMAVVMLIDVLRDFGVGNFLVQEKHITNQHVQAAFTITLMLSFVCALGLLLGTETMVAFYNEPELRHLIPLFVANFLLLPFSMPSFSLLRRDMAFDAIAAISLLSTLVNLSVVVALALLGYGFMSLGWATLAASLTRTIIANAFRPCFWACRLSFKEWRRLVHFGTYSTATAIINVFQDQLPQLIIGRTLGFTSLGFFGRAVTLCQLPDRLVISALNPVVLPALSERVRRNIDLKPTYLQALSYISALQWPSLVVLALLAEPVVLVLLGHQWLEVAPLVRIMATASLAMFPAFMTYPTLVALGRVQDTFAMSLISLPPSILLIFLASPFGLQAVAATQLINAPLQVIVALSFIRRQIGVSWLEIALAVRRSAVVALCAAAAPALVVIIHGGFGNTMSLAAAALASVGAGLGWIAGLILADHPLLAELRDGLRVISRRIGRSA
jgi:O-antigen/teichoic acid export membrane protein